MHINNLKSILQGNFNLIDEIDWPNEAKFEDIVEVTPIYIVDMLTRYMKEQISEDELTNWAGFICTRAEYESPENDLVNEDYYETMWDIISYVSTPEIDEKLSKKLVSEYLNILQKYMA